MGLNIINDKIGARGSTSVDLSYAYRIKFGEGTVALGLQAGIMNWRANWSELSFRDPQGNDKAFADNNQSLWLPSFGAGIYYNNDDFYLGISVPRLAGISLRRDSARTNTRRWAKVYQHFYLTVGGIVELNGKIDFKPSLIIKSVGLFSDFLQKGDQIRNVGAPTSFDLNASFLFYDKLWLGVSFRSAIAAFVEQNGTKSSLASADLLFGYQFPEGMRIGFAYDYPLTKINNYTAGSFEILLGWDFIRKIDKVAHPRYIF
jgi:type IX secretion system PorP/SprF family membrane protein